jgi:hypothetical protein
MVMKEEQKSSEFYTDFAYTTILGGYEAGVTRRDPSPVIKVGEFYYVWYSRSLEGPSGYYADIWYAKSREGTDWDEQGKAIGKGDRGAWDENGVFTPTILVTGDRYYILYTAVPKPFTQEYPPTPTAIGVAMANSPDGPWVRFGDNPILRPGKPGEWDSCRVDDSCLVVRGGKYWLYYKGRELGLSPAETKMGLAISDDPTGLYRKHPSNPVLASGHEVCVWPHREGIAALIAPVGSEGSTVQYGVDGLHFTRKAVVSPPSAPGPYRTDGFVDVPHGTGITWGICQNTREKPRPFLMRFDCDLRA